MLIFDSRNLIRTQAEHKLSLFWHLQLRSVRARERARNLRYRATASAQVKHHACGDGVVVRQGADAEALHAAASDLRCRKVTRSARTFPLSLIQGGGTGRMGVGVGTLSKRASHDSRCGQGEWSVGLKRGGHSVCHHPSHLRLIFAIETS
jgi:hypothetical protein